MPVIQNTDGIVRGDTVNQSGRKAESQAFELLDGLDATSSTGMHGSDRQANRSRRGEHELELAGDLDNEELAQRGDVEEAEERADKGDGEDGTNVVSGRVSLGHDTVEAVHGRDTGDEDTGDATSARGGSLHDRVLLRTKDTADDGHVSAHLLQELEDTITENGAKHVGAEAETSFET